MERRRSESLGEVLSRVLCQNGLQTPLNEYHLIRSWGKIAGEEIARQSSGLRIHNQVLFVRLASPALRSVLMMRRSALVAALNAETGAQVITDIRFS